MMNNDLILSRITLRVEEAYGCRFGGRDLANGIARISSANMQLLGLKENDVIEVIGNRKTLLRCKPLFQHEDTLNIIRMDRPSRNNAKVVARDNVFVSRINVIPASKIMIRPQREIPSQLRNEAEHKIRRTLSDHRRPLLAGDEVAVRFWKVQGCYIFLNIRETIPAQIAVVVDDNALIEFEQADFHFEAYRYLCDWEGDSLRNLRYHALPGRD